jgi:hypothetical protein
MNERRAFFRSCALALTGLLTSRTERLLAATGLNTDPEDPEVPNQEVARILKQLFGDRPIRRGHVELDMPLVAEGPQSGSASRRIPPDTRPRLGVDLHPHQDEANHLGACNRGDQHG